MTDLLDFIKNDPIGFVTGIISIAAAIAAMTPSPKDDGIVRNARKLLDFAALNIFNAKNKEK
ncbi:MAG: hypothetical protein L3J58_11790 [Emcibacter sp.]|nr:hypothetical protein [Emcibacter sp.]